MNHGLSQQSIDKIIGVFRANSKIKEAILYGSRAMGTFHEGSDIDITLKGDELSFDQLMRIESQLDDQMLPYQFDLSIYHRLSNKNLVNHIDRVGISIYKS